MAIEPIFQDRDPLEPHLTDPAKPVPADTEDNTDTYLNLGDSDDGVGDVDGTYGDEPEPEADELTLARLAAAKQMSDTYMRGFLSEWEYSQSAYRNEHSTGSKYRRDQYRNRAKYFKGKTRVAVEKSMAASVAALARTDVVTFEAEDSNSPIQQANAAILKELINHRFSNKTTQAGVPWKLIVGGARQDMRISGFCCSKQDWRYKVRERKSVEMQPALNPDGSPIVNLFTGEPHLEPVTVIDRDILIDKPTITLIRPETVRVDPTADWTNVAQSSAFLGIPWPMRYSSLRTLMDTPNEKSAIKWRKGITDAQLHSVLYSDGELVGINAAREGDKQQVGRQQGNYSFRGFADEVLDVWEWFYDRDGVDYQCWVLGTRFLLSDPVPVHDAYPAHGGMRPYVIGTDQIEAHVVIPESPVHSWRPSQEEINDTANIRMDANRMATFPVAKIKRGSNIDFKAVQNRSPQNVIQVNGMDDVEWDRPPGPTPQSYQEAALLNNDFDEAAGAMSQSSVQSNRDLSQTATGMNLLAGAAGQSSEFSLDISSETWAAPVISQIVMLEQYYEGDATLIAIAGQKGKVFQKYGIDQITNEVLESQVNIKLNVGIGATNPAMRLGKIKAATEMIMPMAMAAEQHGKGEVNFEGYINSVATAADFDDATMWFKPSENDGPPPVPAEKVKQLVGAAQKQIGELTRERDSLKAGHDVDMAKVAVDNRKVDIDELKAKGDIVNQQQDNAKAKGEQNVAVGLPPDYSHEVDIQAQRDQMTALMQDSAQTRMVLAKLVEAMVSATTQTQQQMTTLGMQVGGLARRIDQSAEEAKAVALAPKQIIYDAQGRVAGMQVGAP